MRLLIPVALIAGLLVAWCVFWRGGQAALVVYCAHDAVYSEQIFREFKKRTGIPVVVRYDTEATKSLGLVELLIREKETPRCDVFWNNELLGTLNLQEEGLLQPYQGAGWQRIPAALRDPNGYWTGFAARLRVYIYRPQTITPDQIESRWNGDLTRVAIAKPLYGTTLTHYSVLWQQWGGEKLRAWHQDCRRRGIQEVEGNAAVKDMVSDNVCDFGMTDTDDFFDARDAGKSVAMTPVRLEKDQTICIPNTVAIIRGTRREKAAQAFVDFVLSEEAELALARSKSRQIPLGPVASGSLPADVQELVVWAKDSYPLGQLSPARNNCLAWLKSEYLK